MQGRVKRLVNRQERGANIWGASPCGRRLWAKTCHLKEPSRRYCCRACRAVTRIIPVGLLPAHVQQAAKIGQLLARKEFFRRKTSARHPTPAIALAHPPQSKCLIGCKRQKPERTFDPTGPSCPDARNAPHTGIISHCARLPAGHQVASPDLISTDQARKRKATGFGRFQSMRAGAMTDGA